MTACETDLDRRRRRELRRTVTDRRDELAAVTGTSALSRRVLRLCGTAAVLGAALVLLGIGLAVAEAWVDGFVGPMIALFVVGGITTIGGVCAFAANWEEHANHAAPLAVARRRYDEAFAKYVDHVAGTGGYDDGYDVYLSPIAI